VTSYQPGGFAAPVITQMPSGSLYTWSAAVVMAPGTSYSFTVTGTTGTVGADTLVSNTAYAAGTSGCGGAALFTNETDFVATGSILSITITSATWYDFGMLQKATTTVAATPFVVQNSGNVSETYSLNVTNPAGWTTVPGAPGIDQYRMDALFTGAAPASVNFAADDAIGNASQASTASTFAIPADALGVKGVTVPVSASRQLWLQFAAPLDTVVTIKQRIVVTISAQTP
jgi:hypothetical protein